MKRADEGIRRELVTRLKAAIHEGRYDTEPRLSIAIERLIEDVGTDR